MRKVHFQYYFHVVGQGLFAAGHLWKLDAEKQFNWVFDSGTISSGKFLQRELAKFRAGMNGRPIQLFCLSHFDEDHVNGAVELLSSNRVDVLVMPYFPFVERLQIALSTQDVTDDYVRFLIDPAGYMNAAAGDNLGEVIFIAGGGTLGEELGAESPPDDPRDEGWDFRPPPDGKVPERPESEDLHGVSDESGWQAVRVYSHRKPFKVGSWWEFMFYNENVPSGVVEALRSEVSRIVRLHKRLDGSFDGNALIRDLRPLYIHAFGGSSYDKNKISLIAYSGPVHTLQMAATFLSGRVLPVDRSAIEYVPVLVNPSMHGYSQVSIMYFGDYPLTDSRRLADVMSHFGRTRWPKIEVVQVPHHGSKHSWHKNASASFPHHASVISSRRVCKHHPSQAVLNDLRAHGIVLVHELQSAAFNGAIRI